MTTMTILDPGVIDETPSTATNTTSPTYGMTRALMEHQARVWLIENNHHGCHLDTDPEVEAPKPEDVERLTNLLSIMYANGRRDASPANQSRVAALLVEKSPTGECDCIDCSIAGEPTH